MTSKLPPRLSYTQMSTFNRCRFRFYLQYIRKLSTKQISIGLSRGSILHNAYDAYMFEGRNEEAAYETVNSMVQSLLDNGADAATVNKIDEEARTVLDAYLPYSKAHDDFSIVIPYKGQKQCETTGVVTLEMLDGSTIEVLFKLDMIAYKNGQLMTVENKFRSRLDASGLEHDLQILMYESLWNKLHPEYPIVGTLYNIVGAKPRKTDKKIALRQFVSHSAAEQKIALSNIASTALEMKRAAEATPSVWPMNPNTNCSWDCTFVGLCLSVRNGVKLPDAIAAGGFEARTYDKPTTTEEPLEFAPVTL